LWGPGRQRDKGMDYQHAQIAEIYDLANSKAQDTDFYLSLAGLRPCGVLDLGCGTGVLCCALAERDAEEIKWVESSAQSYKAHRRFDLSS
jgi:predicted RNA methylase